jgi:HEAT repeat protein
MAFVKSEEIYTQRVFRTFLEAQEIFENLDADESLRLEALEYLLIHKEISYILDMLLVQYNDLNSSDHSLLDHAFANFGSKPKRDDDFNSIFKMLESDNAYLRNKAITFLQDSGENAKNFIRKLLKDEQRDIRIFAVNILGDVKYEDSRAMLIDLVQEEKDVNVLMTAIDYLGEIGEQEDIELLMSLKDKFVSEPYVSFGIDMACEKIKG